MYHCLANETKTVLKRHPALIPLSREHHQWLLLAQLLKKDAPAYKGMPGTPTDKVAYARELWEQLIAPHIEKEETYLFPKVAKLAPDLVALLNELRLEHELLRNSFDKLHHEVTTMDRLGRLLERHVRKEERVLFQQVQALLSPQDLELLRILLSTN